MQRTRAQLETMQHDDLVTRVLELQEMLKEGLAVRDALHGVLNTLLNAKADEVARYADASEGALDGDDAEVKHAWAAARHAVSNPLGLMHTRGEEER